MGRVAENLATIRERIACSALKKGRQPEEVTLVAVSKTVDLGKIKEAILAGATIFGENYVQEAGEKIPEAGEGVTWHMIGRLQTNKVKHAVPLFSMVHSVDNVHLAQELSARALALGKVLDILIQVNVSEETSKGGVLPDQVLSLLEAISPLEGVRVKGLMTMPPFFQDPERVRPYFRALRELRDRAVFKLSDTIFLPHLSMGMSGDFEVAIEEGATMVRIGTAIFGERS